MGRATAGWKAVHWESRTAETMVVYWDAWTAARWATCLVDQMAGLMVLLKVAEMVA